MLNYNRQEGEKIITLWLFAVMIISILGLHLLGETLGGSCICKHLARAAIKIRKSELYEREPL